MAAKEIKMPQLGESVTEGTISKWLVAPGDQVNKYDPLAEVMTDKVNAEIPSSFSGTVKELIAKEGDTLAVGETILLIQEDGEDTAIEPAEEMDKGSRAEQEEAHPEQETSGRARFSPAVLRLSQEHGIDLGQVKGTGAGGRITRKDLQLLIDSGEIPGKGKPARVDNAVRDNKEEKSISSAQAPKTAVAPSMPGDVEIPVSGIRKAIAANMARSKQEVPHAWTMVETDVTGLVQLRGRIKDDFRKREGFSLTFFAFFVKAVSQALKEFPQINSMWAGDKIIQKKDVNISIAVATEDALYVPVIKNADEKTIKGIAREIAELADKVRSGKLRPEDMQGGTFTVNNTGSFGSVQSMGIINYPQAAILQVESIVKRPVVMNNGMIAVRDMVNLCLSLDHRVLDGLVCGRFLARVKELLEAVDDTTSIY